MKILTYTQGENDQELFGLLGPWLTDKKVHDELGMAITSQTGDVWRLGFLENIKVGFSLERQTKSTNAIHIRFIYADPDSKKALIEEAIKNAQEKGCGSIWTNDRKSEKSWKRFGFAFTPRARGEFGRWEKQLSKNNKGGVKHV